jgi:hypothetical protein
MDAGKEDVYVTEGYEPLVNAILAAEKVKYEFFIEGVTARYIADKHPNLADKIRKAVELGKIEIGTYTYNHPVRSQATRSQGSAPSTGTASKDSPPARRSPHGGGDRLRISEPIPQRPSRSKR